MTIDFDKKNHHKIVNILLHIILAYVCVLKRTVSLRRFFWVLTAYV